MEQQQVAEALAVDVKAEAQAEPEPQMDAAVGSPLDDASKSKKKKKKKKKNRRKSLEKTQAEELRTKDTDGPEPEEEEEEDNQKDEASIEEAAVTEESTVTQEAAVERTVTEETTVESTVTEESTVESTVTATIMDEHREDANQEHEVAASGDELAPPTLERTSSLDTLKASGTKAVGSLFSRFKVGRKKPLPSRTESVAKLELAVPSPVKTAVKKLEVPEQQLLDDLPMRTKRDFFGESEQSVHVSAEKDKYDTLERQRKAEKEAEEAAIAARRTPPSSSRSNAEVQIELEAAKQQIEAATSSVVESFAETVDKESDDSSVADTEIEPTTEVTSSALSELALEDTITPDDATSIATPGDEVEPTIGVLSEEAPVSVETAESADEQGTTSEVEDASAATVADGIATNGTTEETQIRADATKIEPVSLKLELNLEPRTETTEATPNQVEGTVPESTEAQSDDTSVELSAETVPSESAQSEVTRAEEAELLPVKVTPPTSELLPETTVPAKPERMSPVKSLASRFESKREQSLDSLKFRTVREFFPTERSIRVGAEKQKYEAQAHQQQMEAKAEEEAKAKYKPGFKSLDKEAASGAPSPELKATEAVSMPATATATENGAFSTLDTASSRKKFSFDEGYASANSPSKFSDEALTPVKSIASRFEGKREQSLDSLKFRTVREFFPEERSVRVGSEKQKLEAQSQQDNPLDKLKFRTVREFFPEEGKRSIHVGAEKAKFEAITKQQEEAAKATEQLKLKHAAPSPTLAAENLDSFEVSPNDNTTMETSSSTFDESQAEKAIRAAVTAPEPKGDGAAGLIEDAVAEPEFDESLEETSDSEATAPVEVASSAEAGESDNSAAEPETALEDTLVVTDAQIDAKGVERAAPVSNEEYDVSKAVKGQQPEEIPSSTEEAEITLEPEVVEVDVDDRLVEQDVRDNAEKPEERADVVIAEVPTLKEQASTEKHENHETAHEVEPTVDNEPVDMELDEPVVYDLAESNAATASDCLPDEQVTMADAEKLQEAVEFVGEKTRTTELLELNLGESVEESHTESSVTATRENSSSSVEVNGLDIQQLVELQDDVNESQPEEEESAASVDNGLVELDLGESPAETPKEQFNQEPKSKRPMLTTERSFVMEDDHTIETEDTVVVGERPMTDGEDEFEPLSPSKTRAAHELHAAITSRKSMKESTKETSTPRLTRKVSAGSVGSAKSPPAKTTFPVPMKRASITAPTASYLAKKAAEAAELHKSSPQLKKRDSASKLKGTVSETGFIKPPPAAPTVPIPMRRASITAPTASYTLRKAAEEEAHRASTQPKQHYSASKQKGTVSETGFVKPHPAAPTVHVPMKRASITAPTASWQARNIPNHDASESHTAPKNHAPKTKGTVGPTGFVKPIPPPPTVPVVPKRASLMAPTASYIAKKSAEHANEVDVAARSTLARNKRYSNVKSKVLEVMLSGSTHTISHKKITKEEFIAAERRKSFGSAGVQNVLDVVVDRRASLAARTTIDGPPEPFIRSAVSRKKLNSTVPRYMNYENTPGYSERARQQYERRKRLEEENAAKSEKRQRELRTFYAEQQQKSLMSSEDEVRRGLEAHEFAKLAKESEIEVQKTLRREKERARPTRSHRHASSATSSADASSSNGVASRTSKKSSVSSVCVEEKIVPVPAVELTVLETKEMVESTVVTEETIEVADEEVVTDEQEVVIEAQQVEEQTILVLDVDDDPELEHVAKKIDFDEASSDSDEKDVANE
ncbi:hypothetical protein PHYPSEUDO_008684 [Phytophthora pseudosyringae]|uniref:Uncharacterized protein n=1 Tax=Phytophthora pseudosyringae TaxID=221518 RepID=A0A8T1VDR4_9STRA|nr:hypothetical protein PHYPSEUDO_008684 [Phytophthora pseudosyringae]